MCGSAMITFGTNGLSEITNDVFIPIVNSIAQIKVLIVFIFIMFFLSIYYLSFNQIHLFFSLISYQEAINNLV